MSYEKLKDMDPCDIPIGKLIIIIARGHGLYLNHKLKELNINTSQLHVLFEISQETEINQDMIASRCNVDKGAVARSIKKLEDNNLITRTVDENNRRQNKISLTRNGDSTLKKAQLILRDWESTIFDNLDDREILQRMLKEVAIKTIELNGDL